jgi:multidrug efflux system membrane fusion protein
VDSNRPDGVEEGTADAPPPEPPRRGLFRKFITFAAILMAIGALLYFLAQDYIRRRNAPQASRLALPGGVPVQTACATKGSIGVYLDAIGTVTPIYTASITSQVNGLITGVYYREGQIVHQGDPLIDIDPRPFQALVQQAEGTLQRDTHLLAQAKMDLERYREAWARNAIPKQQLDDQEKLVLQNEATVMSDQGTLQSAQVQLGWCHITAPFAGRVGLRLVDPGNVVVLSAANQVNATTSLVVITQIQPITVVFTLAQEDLSQVLTQKRHGAALPVYTYDSAMQKKIATGTLTAIDNQIDTTTGTVKLRATFRNSDDTLYPNQFVNTRLLVKTLKGVTLIPSQAIQHNQQTTFVFVIAGGQAHIQNVRTGPTDRGMTEVGGIAPNTEVAITNFEKLQNGTPVSPKQSKTPPVSDRGGMP